jgi:RNA methyltransferase, TrmH family
MVVKRIESSKNPTIRALAELKDRKARDKEQKYLIEGVREISRAIQAGEALQTLIYVKELMDKEAQEMIQKQKHLEHLELSREPFNKLTLRQNPDGLIAVAKMKDRRLVEVELSSKALVLIIEGLEKPGNIGALLRTADGANVDAVFITGAGTDLYNPNVIRASMGSVFNPSVLNIDEAELLELLQKKQFNIVAATPHTEHLYWHEDFTGATAIVLGTEDKGLSKVWLEAATTQVTIPMRGMADSLNVATAGALLMYEALRQRGRSST